MTKFTTICTAIVTTLALTHLPANAQSISKGEKAIGVHIGYSTRNESPAAGIFFQYNLNTWLRISPDITYTLRYHGSDALAVNVNFETPLQLGKIKGLDIYPIAGVGYTSWNFHGDGNHWIDQWDDVTTRINRLGLNLGAGIEYHIKPTLKLMAEGTYTFASKHCSTGNIRIGIGCCF